MRSRRRCETGTRGANRPQRHRITESDATDAASPTSSTSPSSDTEPSSLSAMSPPSPLSVDALPTSRASIDTGWANRLQGAVPCLFRPLWTSCWTTCEGRSRTEPIRREASCQQVECLPTRTTSRTRLFSVRLQPCGSKASWSAGLVAASSLQSPPVANTPRRRQDGRPLAAGKSSSRHRGPAGSALAQRWEPLSARLRRLGWSCRLSGYRPTVRNLSHCCGSRSPFRGSGMGTKMRGYALLVVALQWLYS